jgi:hypothetical protein
LEFDAVQEVRSRRGMRHALQGCLRLLTLAFATGRMTLRAVEDFGKDLGRRKQLKALGLGREVPSDTCLFELLGRLSEKGLREAVWAWVKKAWRAKQLSNDAFAGGALSVDGKGAGGDEGPPPNALCRAVASDTGSPRHWHLYSLRACLVSCSARPLLSQSFIGQRAWEMSAFRPLLEEVVAVFGHLFSVVCTDAGMTSAENAKWVRSHGKDYLFGLKANQRRLFTQAHACLKDAPVVAFTSQRAHGATVRRELRRRPPPPDARFPDAAVLLSVTSTHTFDDGRTVREERLFVGSPGVAALSAERMLKLVRLHWGIENGANWTQDMVLKEDGQRPCNKACAPLVLAWLRLMAYNLLATFRAHLPLKDKRPPSFRRTLELLRDALMGAAPGQPAFL